MPIHGNGPHAIDVLGWGIGKRFNGWDAGDDAFVRYAIAVDVDTGSIFKIAGVWNTVAVAVGAGSVDNIQSVTDPIPVAIGETTIPDVIEVASATSINHAIVKVVKR